MAFPRRRTYVRVAILALATAIIGYVTVAHARLWIYRAFVVREYARELDDIQSTMLEWPRDSSADSEKYSWDGPAQKALRATFRTGDFYTARWSCDTHHGLGWAGVPDGGFSPNRWIASGTFESGELCYGKSFSGKSLLIYRRWLPKAPLMKHYEVVFYRDAVDARMLKQQDREPGVGADSR